MQRVAQIAFFVLFLTLLGAGSLDARAQLQPENESLSGSLPAPIEIRKNGKVIARPAPATDEAVRIIVEFDQQPIAAQRFTGSVSKNARVQSLEASHARFLEDLDGLRAAAGANKGPLPATPRHFMQAFNGAALAVPQWMIPEIQSLDYVRAVHREGRLFASDASRLTLPAQTKDPAGVSVGGTGAGIRVAIIDTGIDYTHPALGGGFGALFLVRGGYDFVNDDPDPKDDNGHGTHVAGIVAGLNDSWEGIAPEVALYAYKVLDQDGSGWDSWVLAAIERALDPDENPLTDDAVDIINLSLGTGAGTDSNHPVTLAVEHAVAAGVVCVVAAGNAGHLGKASIAAPGNALAAITVGAITSQGAVASFSSQGPTGSIKTSSLPRFGMKPDVFAPGVDIYSTWLDGTFKNMDGTSMATPHITGMAARILEQNKDWSPAQVKSFLVQMADNSIAMPWLADESHAGTLPARDLRVLATPSRFDFGMVDAAESEWRRSETLTLYNFDTAPKDFTLAARGDYPAGVHVHIDQPALTLAPGESASVAVIISGTYDNIPVKAFPDAYVGDIEIIAAQERLTVPFSFFNPGQARLAMEEFADVLFLFGDEGHEYSFFDVTGDLYLFLPADRYDAIAEFGGGSHVVIKENIFENDGAHTTISKADAVYAVDLDLKDVSGGDLQHVSGIQAITHKPTGYAIVRQGGFLSIASELPATRYFSSFSSAYKVEMKASGFSADGDYYELPFAIVNGLTEDRLFSNASDSLVRVKYHYSVPADHDALYFIPWTYASDDASRRPTIGAQLDLKADSPFVLHPPYEKTLYLAPPPHADFPWQGHFHTLHSAGFSMFKLATSIRDITLLKTDEVRVAPDGGITVGQENMLHYGPGEIPDFYPGAGLMRWAGQLDNSSTRVRIREAPAGGFFVNEWGDLQIRAFSTKLFAGEQQIFADSLVNLPNLPVARWLGESQVTVIPGAHTLVIEDKVTPENGWYARGKAVLEFRTDLADSDPPRISQLFVESDGKPGRILHPQRDHDIVLGVVEVCSWCDNDALPAAVHIAVRVLQDSVWQELEPVLTEGEYRASLPADLSDGHYAIRIVAEDPSGNRLTYTLEPAFELGVSQVPLLQAPIVGQGATSRTPEMQWQPVQGAIAYRAQLAEDLAFEHIVAEAAELKTSTWAPGTLESGHRYYWRVRAITAVGEMPWTQPVWFQTLSNVSADAGGAIPAMFDLKDVYPNPVADRASIRYNLPEPAAVRLEVFDLLGRRVKVLEDAMRPAGAYLHSFEAAGLASGAYLVRMQAGRFMATRKFVLR